MRPCLHTVILCGCFIPQSFQENVARSAWSVIHSLSFCCHCVPSYIGYKRENCPHCHWNWYIDNLCSGGHGIEWIGWNKAIGGWKKSAGNWMAVLVCPALKDYVVMNMSTVFSVAMKTRQLESHPSVTLPRPTCCWRSSSTGPGRDSREAGWRRD